MQQDVDVVLHTRMIQVSNIEESVEFFVIFLGFTDFMYRSMKFCCTSLESI